MINSDEVPETVNRRTVTIVEHSAWTSAHNALAAAARSGPATLALLGSAGTGKTWLLRRLQEELLGSGRPVLFLPQGDLPWELPDGGALLVDEACRMDARSRAELAAQRHGFVVLADLPAFAKTLRFVSPRPAEIVLARLERDQLRTFVDAWAEQADLPAIVTDDAIERLAEHTGGTPRLVAHLLGAALATQAQAGRVDASAIDEVALLRLGGLGTDPAVATNARPEAMAEVERSVEAAPVMPEAPDVPAPAEPVPASAAHAALPPDAIPWPMADAPLRTRKRLHLWRTVAAASCAAACFGLLWFYESGADKTPTSHGAGGPPLIAATVPAPPLAEPAAAPKPSLASTQEAARPASTPALAAAPPVAPADRVQAEAAVASVPADATLAQQADVAAPAAGPDAAAEAARDAGAPAAQLATARAPGPVAAAAPEAASASSADPARIVDAQVATREAPETDAASLPLRGGPGLVLIARRGDTLPRLYANVYQGVQPPPFADFAAANPRPFRPGEIVVFPTPPGGWPRP